MLSLIIYSSTLFLFLWFMVFLFVSGHIAWGNLSFPTREQTCAPYYESRVFFFCLWYIFFLTFLFSVGGIASYQCCDSFSWTAKGHNHTYTWIHSPLRRRQRHPTPVFLPGKSHGRRSLVGCSPWGRKELDMTERLDFHFSLSCTGEGNGNPLQYSCLENPRDRGA